MKAEQRTKGRESDNRKKKIVLSIRGVTMFVVYILCNADLYGIKVY